MHPTQHSTVRRPQTAGEAVAMMAANLQRLAQAHNAATAARLNIAPAPLHQPATTGHQQPASAAAILAASPMGDNPWHLAIVFGLLILGSIASMILWARKVAPRFEKEFEEPETDPVITAAPGAMSPSCAHLVPLHHHCPFCSSGTHQPQNARAKAAFEHWHNHVADSLA